MLLPIFILLLSLLLLLSLRLLLGVSCSFGFMHGCKGGSQHGGARLLLPGRLLPSEAISKWLVAAPTGIRFGDGMEPCVSVWQLTTKSSASVIVAAVILNAVVAIVKAIGPASIFTFSTDAIVGFTKAAIVGFTKAAIVGVDVIFKAILKVGFETIVSAIVRRAASTALNARSGKVQPPCSFQPFELLAHTESASLSFEHAHSDSYQRPAVFQVAEEPAHLRT